MTIHEVDIAIRLNGYKWAGVAAFGGRVLHLIPESSEIGRLAAALCGAGNVWATHPYDRRGKANCRKCIKAAAKAVSA